MMPDKFENISRLSLLSSAHLVHSSVFFDFFGDEVTKSLIRDGVLKSIEWVQLDGTSLSLSLDGIEKSFWINLRDDKIFFEPEDGVGEPFEKALGFEKFVSIDKGALARKLFQENGFSFDSSEISDGNIFWGSRTISGIKIIWCISFSKNTSLVPVLRDALQKTSAKVCLFTSPLFEVVSFEPIIVSVLLPEIKESWIIPPSSYLKSKFHFKSQDYLGIVPSQPLMIDRVEKIIYVFGVRINDKTDDRIYKYVDTLARYAQSSEVTHDHFAYNLLKISRNQSSQGYIGDLRSKIKKKIEDKISDIEKQKIALQSLYEQPRDGAVRCNFSPEDIYFWE
nr:hypothetical protein BHI3_08830 [Bacteriovorax sp. HI3]